MPPRPNPTHFLCVQLASAQLTNSLATFRADVTSLNGFCVPEDAVRPPGTLHLTLGVMSLKPDSLNQALELLKALKPRDVLSELRLANNSSIFTNPTSTSRSGISNTDGLTISFRGIHSMTLASKTSVLYAPPTDTEGILHKFCEQLRRPFRETGLMEDDRPLLLHATIINTIYVKGRGGGRRKERLMIDARDLMDKYEDYVWVEDMPVCRVAICRMGAKKVDGDDEVYEVEGEIEI